MSAAVVYVGTRVLNALYRYGFAFGTGTLATNRSDAHFLRPYGARCQSYEPDTSCHLGPGGRGLCRCRLAEAGLSEGMMISKFGTGRFHECARAVAAGEGDGLSGMEPNCARGPRARRGPGRAGPVRVRAGTPKLQYGVLSYIVLGYRDAGWLVLKIRVQDDLKSGLFAFDGSDLTE
ncbi:hypothetical protein PG988_016230 [Apiospora saccharicola]